MGKKYVVEIGRLERLYKASISAKGMPNMTWLSPEVDLTPYTEPDLERVKKTAHDDGYSEGYQAGRGDLNQVLSDVESDVEQVRKEGYEKGYEKGFIAGHLKAEKSGQSFYEDGYKRGLADAWDAVRKIYNFDLEEREELFHDSERFNVGSICEAYSASEAIEKIRQYEQEKDRQARIEFNCEEIKDVINTTMRECNVSLDEIAEVLQKMKESDNG